MKISEIIFTLEQVAPLMYQESYDNSGLITGERGQEVNKVLLCLDVTPAVLDEAIAKGAGLVIAHHPPVFEAIKKIDGDTQVGRILIKAIQNNIAIYASHTSLDNAREGLNQVLADKLGVTETRILMPQKERLKKLVCFCPTESIEKIRQAIFDAGAGHIGNYDNCAYQSEGQGSFRASENANPYVGEKNKLHFEKEIRLETIYPIHTERNVINALLAAHPYEEVAYDIYPLDNAYELSGSGIIGILSTPLNETDFLYFVKKQLNLHIIRHSALRNKPIHKIAICSGAGAFLASIVKASGADAFISSEFKHNQFIDWQNNFLITDIGHFESEHFAKELIKSIINKKFPKFAVVLSESEENPVKYI